MLPNQNVAKGNHSTYRQKLLTCKNNGIFSIKKYTCIPPSFPMNKSGIFAALKKEYTYNITIPFHLVDLFVNITPYNITLNIELFKVE